MGSRLHLVRSDEMVYRFKVLRGSHTDGDPHQGTSKVYNRGDIVTSDIDLAKVFGRNKFMNLNELEDPRANSGTVNTATVTVPTKESLSKMTNKELRALAEEEEIDVTTCTSKEELINAITSGLGI